MPEYLAPGVYVEETSYRSKTIEGVSTSTAGFVGPARFGPTEGEPELLTGFADFERIYGGLDMLNFTGESGKTHNYLAHAVRAFFEEGGKRLYVSRVCDTSAFKAALTINGAGSPPAGTVAVNARYPGEAGNVVVAFTFKLSRNILDTGGVPELMGASNYDLVWVTDTASPPASPPGTGDLYWLEKYFDNNLWTYRLRKEDPGDTENDYLVSELDDTVEVRILTVSVAMGALGAFSHEQSWEDLSFHPGHKSALTKVFTAEPANRSTALYVPLVMEAGGLKNGVAIAEVLLAQLGDSVASPPVSWLDILSESDPTPSELTFKIQLANGSDGNRPGAEQFKGSEDAVTGLKSGLTAFEDLEDISIVAAPGSSCTDYDDESDRAATVRYLISHCEKMRYRIGVLDSTDGQMVSEVRSYRGKLDSKHAALYYPWIKVLDPVTGEELNLPPSGFVSGIYARNDVEYGVHKAPANEVVRMAIGFETLLNKAQQEVLNPEGVNCFRFFEGRGYRLWGARTITSDPEWKYVNLRRYFAYLERSIEKHTQWVVFENNSTPLWGNVRSTVEDFLYNEWKSNHLMGDEPKEAYFVRCDRSTMTQNDIDNGRLICLIGVAPVRPAEFVIFRIGQWTADRKK